MLAANPSKAGRIFVSVIESLPLAEIIYNAMISCEPRTTQQGAADAANAIIELVRAIENGEHNDLPPLGDSLRVGG
jgi:hypothetical protein